MGLRLDRKTDEKVEFYLFSLFLLSTTSSNPADIYLFKGNQRIFKKKVWNMFKVNNQDTRTTLLKFFSVFIVNCEDIWHLF